MKIKICFATRNKDKICEIGALLPAPITLVSLDEIGCHVELPETTNTFIGNARDKAAYVYRHYQVPCFADDSGLVVPALNGDPGVHSAYYAGTPKNNEANNALLLKHMAAVEDRSAFFKTVLLYIDQQGEKVFEGELQGTITHRLRGEGFGYDPLFRPNGYTKTFAEMSLAEKNQISHRQMAFQKLITYLTARYTL